MMGTRLDLQVFEEPEEVSRKRWTAKRIIYLEGLLKASSMDTATRAGLERELAGLKNTGS